MISPTFEVQVAPNSFGSSGLARQDVGFKLRVYRVRGSFF